MTKNDVFRQLRYILNFNDEKMVDIFKLADLDVTTAQVKSWLSKEGHHNFVDIEDVQLATFLNGLINEMRGKREGPQPIPEEILTNNGILRKLKIAYNLKANEMLDVFELADMHLSKHELSAFFRKPGQSQYRVCQNQFLRNFLYGLQLKHRPEEA